MTVSQVEKLLTLAKGEVGTHETRSGGHWVNDSKYNRWFGKIPGYDRDGYGYPYCAAFISWLADKAGVRDLYPHTASCEVGVAWFKNKGQFSEYPAVGAQVFFGPRGGTHTGVVYKFDATRIWTREGNTNTSGSPEGDGVYEKVHNRTDSYVYGYGYPKFAEPLVTADPSKKDKEGFAYKASASAPVTPVKTDPKPAVPKPSPVKPKPVVSYEPWPGYAYLKSFPKDSLITRLGKRLVAEGCSAYASGPGPQFTESDRKSCRKWQLKLGYRGSDADGWLGKVSWDKLKVPRA